MKRSNANLEPVVVFGPLAMNADNTPASVDLVDCNSAEIQIAVGVGGITFDGTNKILFKVTHSDDDSSYSDVGADDVILGTNADAAVTTGGVVKSLITAHAAADITRVSYIGNKRYIKVLADFSGTHGTATPIMVSVQKTRLSIVGST